jgi:hypothetical protein
VSLLGSPEACALPRSFAEMHQAPQEAVREGPADNEYEHQSLDAGEPGSTHGAAVGQPLVCRTGLFEQDAKKPPTAL